MANYKYRPKFVPGPKPCVIKSYSLKRGRVLAGGAAFRNKQIGQHVINIKSEWFTNTLSGGLPVGPLDPTDLEEDVKSVRLTVTGTDAKGTPHTNEYWAEQFGNFTVPEQPVWVSAIPTLRVDINNNDPILSMPEVDVQLPFDAASQGEYLEEFNVNTISTGNSLPSTPAGLAAIRTGPSFTLIYVVNTETETIDDGALTDIGEVWEWNGFVWVRHD